MPNMIMLHRYFYLDTDGIESLYAQTVEKLEVEYTESKEKGKIGKTIGKLGLGKLLADMGIEIESSISNKALQEIKYKLSPEQKIRILTSYLNSLDTQLFSDLLKGANWCKETGKGTFVDIEQQFNAPQFYKYPDGVKEVSETGSMMFEIGESRDEPYEPSDKYFRPSYFFFMNASLSKSVYPKGMGNTSHEALFFRALKGKNLPLGVFGYLQTVGKYAFQIKPFAIWR